MAAGTSTVIVCAGAFFAGVALGWFGRAHYDGSVVSVQDAAQQSQQAVDAGAAAAGAIEAARTETETAVERVRVVTRTVEVAGSCPPGAGPVSDGFAAELRALAKARSDAGTGAGGLRADRND